MATPNPSWPSDATTSALAGTIDDKSFLYYIPSGVGPSDTPPLSIHEFRNEYRLNGLLAPLLTGKVWQEAALKVGVNGGEYILGAAVKTFAGATDQAVADDDTNYVYINDSNALVINTTGFPGDLTTFVPLATVVAVSGAITSITDNRSRTLLTVSNASGSFANDALDNLADVAVNTSLVSDTDDTDDLGSAAIAWQNLFVGGSVIYGGASRGQALTLAAAIPAAADRIVTIPDPGADDDLVIRKLAQTLESKTLKGAVVETMLGLIFSQATAALTIKATDPAGAREYTLPDAGAAADFVMTAGAQTLAGKTLTTPTIADLTNATHDHADAAGGGTLDETSHGTGKYCPIVLSAVIEEDPLTVGVKRARIVAPVAFTWRNLRGSVVTAPTGDTLIVDGRVNGTSIFANQAEMVSIAAGTTEDASATKDHAVSQDDVIDFEIEQVGSTEPGEYLTMTVYGLAALDAAA